MTFQILQKILMRHQRMKLTKIFSGFWKLAWTRFNKSAMWFQSFTDTENINCYQFSNIIFCILIMLFVQHSRSFDFAFCTSSQDLFFWSKSKVLVQFEGVLIFNSCFLFVLFVWGIFGVCVFFCMRVGMCVHSGAQIGKQFYLSSSFPGRNKTNLYICYFLFFLITHRINEK